MKPFQGLSYLALVIRAAGGRTERSSFAGMRLATVATFCLLSTVRSAGQTAPPETKAELSISAERLDEVQVARRDSNFLTYKFSEQLADNFEWRSLELYAMRQHLRNKDDEEISEVFARSTRRRVERSVTRTAVRAFERTEFMNNLRDGAWRERLFQVAKDSITEETPTIGTPVADDDPNVDYEVEKAIVPRPAWRDALSFFVRPWSLHPNMGIGFKIDGVRAEIKAYHDEVKFSAVKPITDDWTFFTSARMKGYTPADTSFSFGFQHLIQCASGVAPALLQYGVSVKNQSFFQQGTSHHEFRPTAFLAFVFDY